MVYKKHLKNLYIKYYKLQDFIPQTQPSLVKALDYQTLTAKLQKDVGAV